jgi:glycine/D-amino acid oxidase-like deaminating enzyme
LGREDLRQRVGTGFYQSGIYSPHGYLVQPAALIRSIADQLPDKTTLYEDSPALELRRVDAGWRVRTPAGQVTASKVVVANNAFAKALGVGKSRVATIYTYAGISEPLSETDLSQLGSEEAWGLLPTHRLGSTFRRTSDGRILVRSLYDYEAESDNKNVERKLMDCLRSRYPALEHVRLAKIWGGATGITANGAPLWGETEPGLYVSVGCNGAGVVKGTLFGHLLADLAQGRGVPDIAALFGTASWMPGEPFRRIGFNLISSLEQRRGRAEV